MVRPATNQTRFTVGAAFGGWLVCSLIAIVVTVTVISLSGHTDTPADEYPIWITFAALVALWVPFLALLVIVSDRYGTGRPREDYRLSFRLVDLVGVPIGVLSQFVLVPLVYWPLEAWFPATFDESKLEERARELWDRADGVWLVALVLLVAIGAPLVEELVYRGLIQQSLQSRLDDVVAIVVSAAFFAAIHQVFVEFFGLFAFAIVLGVCFRRTGRLGMPIVAHVAFNASGLVIASLA